MMHLAYTPPPPPQTKKLHNHCFQFRLGITVVPREIGDNGYAKFEEGWGRGGLNKVHYGLYENGEHNQTKRRK